MNGWRSLENTIIPLLAPALAGIVGKIAGGLIEQLTEIRLRAGRPLLVVAGKRDYFIDGGGRTVNEAGSAYMCSREDLAKTLQLISRNSIYAYEQELKQGFFTVAGGHRIGLAGQAIMNDGELRALKNITGMNIRIARQLPDIALPVMPYILTDEPRVCSTLVIGPPCSGKTTLLRDIARLLSAGVLPLRFHGVQVGVVDERSELAACQDGMPTADLGPRADVLDGCPKASGMLMLIRSMGPRVVVTDELGRQEDAMAVREALHAGVSVIASVHGQDHQDVLSRPFIGELIREKAFDRYIVVSDKPRIGTVEMVVAAKAGEVLHLRPKEVRECG